MDRARLATGVCGGIPSKSAPQMVELFGKRMEVARDGRTWFRRPSGDSAWVALGEDCCTQLEQQFASAARDKSASLQPAQHEGDESSLGQDAVTPLLAQHDGSQLEMHPLALLFPPLNAAEFQALVEDIQQHGLRQPIALLDGKVLDGRHRLLACQKLGMTPEYVHLSKDTDPAAYVVSMNFRRRHLTPGQRAAVGVELLEKIGELRSSLPGRRKGGKNSTITTGSKSRDRAAALAGTNPKYISDAKAIRARSPEVFAELRNGAISIAEAKRRVANGGIQSVKRAACAKSHRRANPNRPPALETTIDQLRQELRPSDKMQVRRREDADAGGELVVTLLADAELHNSGLAALSQLVSRASAVSIVAHGLVIRLPQGPMDMRQWAGFGHNAASNQHDPVSHE